MINTLSRYLLDTRDFVSMISRVGFKEEVVTAKLAFVSGTKHAFKAVSDQLYDSRSACLTGAVILAGLLSLISFHYFILNHL